LFHPPIFRFKMAPLSNKLLVAALLLFLSGWCHAQDDDLTPDYKDYKTDGEFHRFHRKAKVIAAWQINKLKEGALVVRLKTNKSLIDNLRASGNERLARQKMAETYIVNKHTMMAYLNNFKFCKVYFIFSNSSDSLLKGTRSGIFLDTNLHINPAIEMRESFYLLAERDYAYNSSIGFLPEDSAMLVKETGTPVREMGVVIKNRYGHQLKNPFPYYVKDKTFADYTIPFYVLPVDNGNRLVWVLSEEKELKENLRRSYPNAGEAIEAKLKKQFMYPQIAYIIAELNDSFDTYYKSSVMPDVQKMKGNTKLYLY